MKRISIQLFLALLAWGACPSSVQATHILPGQLPTRFDAHTVEVRPLVESTPRGGLPHFYQKLEQRQQEVSIAYFGGSITEQDGYRIHSRKFFQQQYPDTKINEINAAIGGTGSDLGVFRCWHDVLRHNPDLVIVEFAVNDYGMSVVNIRKQMEGIVRQVWRHDATTDILFVYTLTADHIKELQRGCMPRSASVMEEIADYYDIPSIHMGVEVTRLVGEDKLTMKAEREEATPRVSGDETGTDGTIPTNADGKIPFAKDGVHPYPDTGHALYLSAIRRSLPTIKAAGRLCPHSLPASMVPDCLEQVATVSFDDEWVRKTGPWKKNDATDAITKPFLKRCDDFFTFEPGAEVTFCFRGSKASIYDLLGPECAILSVTVDSQPVRMVPRFDGYCTYHRLALMYVCDNLDPSKVHRVGIKVTNQDVRKRDILFEHNKADYDNNPQKYAPTHAFAGNIFIVGELVEPDM
ncbi:MAG: SGNH/GDSL hydrolase family protein [Bacteroidales bacterium]|nr:SGNH/GDSL hydrolase family protein [Bacteroidales bacterium]